MIRCHLARMMGEHKMRIADVARETGLSRVTVTLLYKETAQKVDLEAIDKLCELFDCGIGELLECTTTLATSKHQTLDANH
ncbi:helix-turn-helix domain-containing protein [Morganella morganii]|uniref:helix-turn-helix domain-containing protein n=1 Tax=Morganella morganii TaxID=582 RepID=UPI0034D69E4B